jgi:hypothetical protein
MTLVEPARIISRAAVAVKELHDTETWRAALDKATVAPSPLLVRSIAPAVEARAGVPARLPDYYIVFVVRGSGTSARFAYDAESADLLEAEGVRKAGDVFKPYVDTWPIVRERVAVTDGAALSAEVVWMPCRESTSRFAPFWRYYIQDQPVYVRADGVLYSQLTTAGRG